MEFVDEVKFYLPFPLYKLVKYKVWPERRVNKILLWEKAILRRKSEL